MVSFFGEMEKVSNKGSILINCKLIYTNTLLYILHSGKLAYLGTEKKKVHDSYVKLSNDEAFSITKKKKDVTAIPQNRITILSFILLSI